MSSRSRKSLDSTFLTIAVVVLIYRERAPAVLDVPGVKTGLDHALPFIGMLLVGRLFKVGAQKVWALRNRMACWFTKLRKGFDFKVVFRSDENDSGA